MPKAKKGKKGRRKKQAEPEEEEAVDDIVVVRPEDQDQLTAAELEDDETRILRASDPNAPENVTCFHYDEQQFKMQPTLPQMAVHFDHSYALLMHRDSDDAKAQLATEAQIIEKEKAVLRELEEAAAATAKEEGNMAEEVEDSAALRNQFNFSDRTYQTMRLGRRHAAAMTVPPDSIEFSANASQWGIWDRYAEDLKEKEARVEKEKNRSKSKKKTSTSATRKVVENSAKTQKDPIYSSEMRRSLRLIERVVNQNSYDDILMDFAFWEDDSDKLNTEAGSLLPLWQFASAVARHRMVTDLCWNARHNDLFAVGLGSFDFRRQSTGVVAVYSLKSPSCPDYVYHVDAGVMCIDFNTASMTALLACGMYDGSVCVFDLGRKDEKTLGYSKEPVAQSNITTGKHMDPVWQLRWSTEAENGVSSFLTISTDGRLLQWALTSNEMQVEEIMQFRLIQEDVGVEEEAIGNAGSSCFAFAKGSGNIFVVGTEEGDIYKCSTAYSNEYIASYEGHDMNVYTVAYNCFHDRLFLSCSADWTVKLWDDRHTASVLSWDLSNAVVDVAWAPFSSTIFACVTANASVHVFDIAQNKLVAMCVQKVVRKSKLTRICFNATEPVLLVGDDKGSVLALKLSPNLRKLTEVESHKDKKTGEKLPPPTDAADLKKWQQEELDAELEKLQQVVDRALAARSVGLGSA